MTKNIDSRRSRFPPWDPAQPAASLQKIYDYVEQQAAQAIDWYLDAKDWKGRFSYSLRLFTILFTALGGLIPVAATILFEHHEHRLRFDQYGYLSVGLAALFLSLDRFSGSSTGWMRYMTAVMALESLVESLRLDWARFQADLGQAPSGPDSIHRGLDLLRTAGVAIRTIVKDETDRWIAEFQTDLAQIEQNTKQAFEEARAESKRQAEESRKRAEEEVLALRSAQDAQRPGAIDLSVVFVAPPDEGYSVEIDGKLHRERLTGPTCGIVNVQPGLHELCVVASAGQRRLQVSKVVQVAGNQTVTVQLELK